MGLSSRIAPDIDKATIFDRDGGSCAKCFVDGVDVSVDENAVSFLRVTKPWGRQCERHDQQSYDLCADCHYLRLPHPFIEALA